MDLANRPAAELVTQTSVFSPTDRVSQVIGFLKESKSYDAFVEEGDKTWILSIRDLLDAGSVETKLETLTRRVPRLNDQNTLGDAAALMFEYRTRSIPVYRGAKFMGAVTSPTIVSNLIDSTSGIKLPSIMTPNPITVAPGSTVSAARDLMRRKRIDQVPVVQDGKVLGIVTSEEVVFNLMPRVDRNQKGNWETGRYSETVEIFSSKDFLTADITGSIRDVYLDMSKRGANYSMVLSTGELQGIVTYRDFMRLLLKTSASLSVPMYVIGLPDDAFEATAVRGKLQESIALLQRARPDISEVRVVIKTPDKKAQKRRSQVNVLVLTPTKRHSFSTSSYELANAFDEVHAWMKKVVAQDKPVRERPTQRRPGAA